MKQEITEGKIESEKLKLHIKYIIFMAAVCVISVIILSFCEDTMFKNCISVASTVTSIILSVIAIILSVTGERTTNEIRNKVTDSVEHLETCTDKSSKLAEEMTSTLQQLNLLYTNVNERILDQFPILKDSLKADIFQNERSEDDGNFEEEYIKKKTGSIADFLGVLPVHTRQNIKKALVFMKKEMHENHKSIQPGDIMQHLLDEGADTQLSVLVTGMVIGYLSSGVLNGNGLDMLIEKIEKKEQD